MAEAKVSAANVSKAWIGLEAERLFEDALGRGIHFVNDADAAGFAEDHYGAAKDASGLVIMTTLGTGIGGALIYDGVLIPNAELGHLELDGYDAETRASNRARETEGLSWEAWWLDDAEAVFHCREQAYRLYRADGDDAA